MNRLIRFSFSAGRCGTLHGLFVADEEEWKFLQHLKEHKTEIYFGEVLGKHSEVSGPLSDDDIDVLSENQSLIDELLQANGGDPDLLGYNPLDYAPEVKTEGDDDE